jgi:glycosyltransferase involved in cell wall biosynthesis
MIPPVDSDSASTSPSVDDRSAAAPGSGPTVAVVIPFHGRHELLDRCLEAVGRLSPRPAEVVVVGDGENEARLESAERHGCFVLSTSHRCGPAAARNFGAAAVGSDVVLFVDADVVVPVDTVARVRRVFAEHPGTAAVFGSYDDRPPAPGLVSRYKNLLHHWTHQHAFEAATTFWTGCGAVRREVFLAAGGFDPSQPWLEDVELGYRLHAAGHRIILDRSLQVTHLKEWSLRGLLISDVFHRALPWTELVCRYRILPRDLNTDVTGRVSGGLAVAAALSLLGLLASPWCGVGVVAALGGMSWLNRRLYRFFFRRGGLSLLLTGAVLHWLYLVYGTAVFVTGALWWRVVGTRRATTRPPLTGRQTDVGWSEGRAQVAAADGAETDGSRSRARRRSA